MNEFEVWFVLLSISNKNKLKLLAKYNTEENVYNNRGEINCRYRTKGNSVVNLSKINYQENKKLLGYINKEGIGYITINSKEYPVELKNLEEPPYVLFYKGDLSIFNSKRIAIVGARNCTTYGSEVTKIITRELCKNEITVVSGVASGVDSIAHRVTIDEKAKNIGVLGCGIDIVYPKMNSKLYNDIASTGLLISEFIPGTRPMPYNFPRRNRIISGLSEGIIVVEASVKSGSLITASFALDQGKDVIAVPGSVLNSSSLGCNKLIRDGAYIFTEIEDLYDIFNISKKNSKNNAKNTQNNILLELIKNEPIHLDDIVSRVNVDRKVLFGLLFEMQKRNEIICLPGNYYAKLT